MFDSFWALLLLVTEMEDELKKLIEWEVLLLEFAFFVVFGSD
jgi:hypothetical protein